jgi:Lrp/AsnC family transcriptional regulator for asnA, asnC and gidA
MGSIKKDIIIDYLDREIIKKLSENARMPFSDLAKELNISNSLVHLRVRKMQETGIISGFTVKLNTKEIGYETVTYTGIVTKEARFSYSIAEKLKEIPEVLECHWVSGTYALFIKIAAINNEELRKILYEQIHQIEGVGSTDSFFSFGSAFEKNLIV